MRLAVPLWFIALGILPALAGGCGSINTDLGDGDDEGAEADAGPGEDGGGGTDAGPTPPDDGGDGGGADSGPPACDWGRPTDAPFGEINSDGFEESASLTGDGTTLLFTRFTDGDGDTDVFEATRSSEGAPFSNPQPIEELNSPELELEIEISADGREIFFLRAPKTGPSDTIFSARRASPGAAFGEVQSTGLIGFSPTLSGDGLTLYFIDAGLARIMRATRQAIGQPWDNPVEVGPVGLFDSIEVSPDELRLLMSRPGGAQEPVAIATRDSIDEPFGAAITAGEAFRFEEDVSPFVEASWDASQRQIVIPFDLGEGTATDLYLSTCE
jgi:WD40-like Beta Propeller Repeat